MTPFPATFLDLQQPAPAPWPLRRPAAPEDVALAPPIDTRFNRIVTTGIGALLAVTALVIHRNTTWTSSPVFPSMRDHRGATPA